MQAIITKHHEEGNLVGINVDGEADAIYVGWILNYDQSWLILHLVSDLGVFAGYKLLEIDAIYYMEDSNTYLNKIEDEYAANQQPAPDFSMAKANLFNATLRQLAEEKVICSIAMDDYELHGWIKGYDEDQVTLAVINRSGLPDGHTYFAKAIIETLSWGGPVHKALTDND